MDVIRISKNIYLDESDINKGHTNRIAMKLNELKARLKKYKDDRMAGAMKYAGAFTFSNQEAVEHLANLRKKRK